MRMALHIGLHYCVPASLNFDLELPGVHGNPIEANKVLYTTLVRTWLPVPFSVPRDHHVTG
jgi:hypothetical protein